MKSCPPDDTLRLLLSRGLGFEDHAPVELHVESCARCQSVLEQLTEVPAPVDLAARRPGETARRRLLEHEESPSAEFLHRLAERAAEEDSAARSPEEAHEPAGGSGLGRWRRSKPIAKASARGSGAAPPSSPVPAIPGFEVLGEIGRGGFSVVYKAVQTRLNRVCALKMILDSDPEADATALRLLIEAEAVARLSNVNVVQIYSIGEHAGRPYLELEFVEGGSLREWINGSPKHFEAAARKAETLAAVLVELHALGIVHRDLKPSNVLLTTDGTPKIADFGLARVESSSSDLTRSRMVVGSPAYMSPEQAGAGGATAGPAADVYSLGVILYEMLVGRPPFQGTTVLETIEQVKWSEPVSPSRLTPGIPRDLVTIVLKCLQKAPDRRYASARQLRDDLRRFLEGRPILGRRPGPAELAWRWCRRSPVAAAAIGVAAACLLGTLAVVATSNVKLRRNGETLNSALADRKTEYLRAERLATGLALDRGISLAESGQVGQGILWMADAARRVPAVCPDLEGQIRHNIASWSRLQPRLVRVFDHGAAISCAAVAPDRKTLVTGGRDGVVRLWDLDSGRALSPSARPGGPISKIAIHPNGRTLLVVHRKPGATVEEALSIRTFPGCIEQRRVGLGPSYAQSLSITPDGKSAAIVLHIDNGMLRLVSIEDGSQTDRRMEFTFGGEPARFDPAGRFLAVGGEFHTFLADASTLREIFRIPTWLSLDFAFSPDGRSLLFGGLKGSAQIVDIPSGRPRGIEFRHADGVTSVAFSPDGLYAATGSLDRTARLWDVGSGRPMGAVLQHGDAVQHVEYIQDGTALLTAGDDGTARVWDVREVLGGGDTVLPQLTKRRPKLPEGKADPYLTTTALVLSPDGSRLFVGNSRLYGRGDARLWDTAAGRPASAAMPHDGAIHVASFRGDSKLLITGGGWYNDFTSGRIWDAATGKPFSDEFDHAGYVTDVGFSPDGRIALTASYDNSIKLRSVSRRAESIGERIFEPGMFFSARFSPSGDRIVTGHERNAALLWDVATRRKVGPPMMHAHHVAMADFSPDGSLIASASWDGTLRLWDARTGQQIGRPIRKQASPRQAFAFSRVGRTILVGALSDNTARWFDTQTAMSVGEPLPHSSLVVQVALSKAGDRAMTVTADGAVRAWDVATHKPISAPLFPGDGAQRALLTSDGRRIIVACSDATIRMIDLPDAGSEPLTSLAGRTERGTGLHVGSADAELPDALKRPEPTSDDDPTDPLPSPTADWHRTQAAIAVSRSDWFAANWHQDRAPAPDDGWSSSVRVRALCGLGRFAEAEQVVRATSSRGDLVRHLDADAYVLELDDDWATAEWYLHRLAELAPGDAAYLARRGRALAMLDRPAEARAEIDRAVAAGLDAAELDHLAYLTGGWLRWKAALPLAVAALGRSDDPRSTAPLIAALAGLSVGDRAAYRLACSRIAADIPKLATTGRDADILAHRLRMLTLAPHDVGLGPAISASRDLIRDTPSSSQLEFADRIGILRGLLFRAGRDAEAIGPIEREGERGNSVTCSESYFQAQSNRRLGRAAEAASYLELYRKDRPLGFEVSTDWRGIASMLLVTD